MQPHPDLDAEPTAEASITAGTGAVPAVDTDVDMNSANNPSHQPSDPTIPAELQGIIQNPALFTPLISLIVTALQQANHSAITLSATQALDLSSAIAQQVSERISKRIEEQVQQQVERQVQHHPSGPRAAHSAGKPRFRRNVATLSADVPMDGQDIVNADLKTNPAEHQLNRLISDYVKGKKLWHSPSIDIPPPPSDADVKNYQDRRAGCPGPRVDEPRFDWNLTLSHSSPSRWNKDLLVLLASELRDRIRTVTQNLSAAAAAAGDQASSASHAMPRRGKPKPKPISTPFDLLKIDPTKTTLPALVQALEQRLKLTRTAYLDKQPPPTGSPETLEQKARRVQAKRDQAKKRDRISGRKRGLYRHRKRIAANRRNDNPTFWDSVDTLLDELGEGGMSGDETEVEAYGVRLKEVRRFRTSWRHSVITEIFDYVDRTGDGRVGGAGNSSYLRHRETKSDCANHNGCLKGIPAQLPENYYDEVWRNGLTEGQRISIEFATPRSFPSVPQMDP